MTQRVERKSNIIQYNPLKTPTLLSSFARLQEKKMRRESRRKRGGKPQRDVILKFRNHSGFMATKSLGVLQSLYGGKWSLFFKFPKGAGATCCPSN